MQGLMQSPFPLLDCGKAALASHCLSSFQALCPEMHTQGPQAMPHAQLLSYQQSLVWLVIVSGHFPNLQGIKNQCRTSLVAQWLRIRLPMQGTRVRALVWEDPTCHGATKPMRHNY